MVGEDVGAALPSLASHIGSGARDTRSVAATTRILVEELSRDGNVLGMPPTLNQLPEVV